MRFFGQSLHCELVFNVVTTSSISTIPFKAPLFTKTIASVAGVVISDRYDRVVILLVVDLAVRE
jgi:hypothetical protein